MSKKNVVGIDLGTSFSSIARLDSYGRPEVLPNAEGEQMTPSAIYFGDEGPVIGKEAMKSGSDDPERLVENAKRFLGSTFKGWKIDRSLVTPLDATSHILRKLKLETEEQIGPIAGAVISVPVHFSIQQRELTMSAAKRVGLTVLGLVNEPVAGALTFILGEQGLAYAALADEQTILVYDLGGGTFDLSIVHYSEEGIDVKAATGEMKLGGIDWNQRLIDVIAQRFWDKRGYDIRRDAKMLRKLAENIEDAKRSLSNPKKPFTNVSIRYEGYAESFKITREEFEEVTKDLVERTRVLTDGLVRSTVRRWDLLNQVLPVGGATRMPMIREAIRQMCVKTMGEVFGLEPNYRLSPDLAIAQGAALYAGLLAGEGPTGTEWAKQTYVPKMISSRGLGMAVRNHEGQRVNHILIPTASRLPASVSVGVETIKPGQERISLKIVEAEDEHFRDEDVLLRCEINDLPKDLPEGSGFDVVLTCEPSGLLQVVATHRDSGRIATAILKRDPSTIGEVVDTDDEQTATAEAQSPADELFSATPATDAPPLQAEGTLPDFTESDFMDRPEHAPAHLEATALQMPPFETVASPDRPVPASPAFHETLAFESVERDLLIPDEIQPVDDDSLFSEKIAADAHREPAPKPDRKEKVVPDEMATFDDAETLAPIEEELEPIMLEFFEEEELEPVPLDEDAAAKILEDDDPFSFDEKPKPAKFKSSRRGEPEVEPPPRAKKLDPPPKKSRRDEPEDEPPPRAKKSEPPPKTSRRDEPPPRDDPPPKSKKPLSKWKPPDDELPLSLD